MKYFLRTQSKGDYKALGQLLDSFQDDVLISAYSHEQFYYVADINSKKVIEELKSSDAVKVESEKEYLK